LVTPDANGHVSAQNLTDAGVTTKIGGWVRDPNTWAINPDSGFYQCTALKSIEIPTTVTEIGYAAFFGTAFTSVTIPSSVTEIGDYAFQGSGLTSVVIPSSVTEIGLNAFRGAALTSIDFSGATSLETIGGAAFQGSGLTSVVIPSSVTEIGAAAFKDTPLATATLSVCTATTGNNAFPSTTHLNKVFTQSCLQHYLSQGIVAADILAHFSAEELKAAYRVKGNCPA